MSVKITPTPRFLTFDVFSALFDWEGSLAPAVKNLLKGQKRVDVTAFLQLWRRTQLEYTYVTTLLGGEFLNFETLTRRSLEYAVKVFRIASKEDQLNELVEAWSKLDAFPDVREGLLQLKTKYVMAMLSNGDHAMLSRLADRLGVKFQNIVSADVARVYKPHPRIYNEAVKLMGNDASRILHVAGSARDAIGAKAVGMRTAWINRKDLPMDWNYPLDLGVKSFRELTSALLA
jgi:2-haloacid dehalogenase